MAKKVAKRNGRERREGRKFAQEPDRAQIATPKQDLLAAAPTTEARIPVITEATPAATTPAKAQAIETHTEAPVAATKTQELSQRIANKEAEAREKAPAQPAAMKGAEEKFQGQELREIKPRRRKRVRLGEAFRKAGLDEHAVAETYVGVVEKLRRRKNGSETVEKLLVEVLKECSRVLEPGRPGGTGASEGPTMVTLHHNVPRPKRELPLEERKREETKRP